MVGEFVVVGFASNGLCMVVVLGLLVVIASKGRERERERETYMNNKKEYLNKVVKFFFLNY